MRRQHLLKILSYSAKNVWLLIFPLIRGLLSIKLGDAQAFLDWLKGAWFDILTVVLIIFTGYIRWFFSYYIVKEDAIVLKNGVFIKTSKTIPIQKISSITEEHSFFLKPFKATKLIINTCAGTLDNDLSILVNYCDLHYIRRSLNSDDTDTLDENGNTNVTFYYKPKFWSTFFFSFIFSSTLSGAIYIFVFLFKTGSILEQFFQRSVLDEFNMVTENVSQMLMLNVSPIFVSLSLIIAVSWLISFITNVIRYTNFKLKRKPDAVYIRTGVLTERFYKIVPNMVNYVDLCQNFITKLFRYVSINVNCSGYGSTHKEIPVFIPIMSKKHCQQTISAIMPNVKVNNSQYKPKITTFWRYIYPAVFLCGGIALAYYISIYYFPTLTDLIKYIAIMSEIPSIWYLIVRIMALFTSGFSLKEDLLCIRYAKRFTFHTILVAESNITKVCITQTIFQSFSDTYDITFYLNSEQSQLHRVKGLNRSAIEVFL